MTSGKVRPILLATVVLSTVLGISLLAFAQARKGVAPIARFTATTANVASSGQSVKIDLFGWSSDSDRDQLAKVWADPLPKPPEPAAAPAAPRGGGAAGRGGRGARGAAPADAGAAADVGAAAAGADAAAAGGRGARGGRGANAGAGAADDGYGGTVTGMGPKIVTHTSLLKEALNKQPTQGILWTSETAGYAIRYAYQMKQADGSQRIILITDRKVGAYNNAWKPMAAAGTAAKAAPAAPAAAPTTGDAKEDPKDYSFSVIELRVPATGLGEGKLSLDNPISVDGTAKTLAIENYGTLPVVLKGVKKAS